MLPKKNVVKKSSEITEIFKKGKTFKSPFFILKFFKKNEEEIKILAMVGKKVEKSAVKRNRIKRIFKSAFLEILKKEKLLGNFLFIPSINTLNKKSSEIKNEIFNFFKKNNIL